MEIDTRNTRPMNCPILRIHIDKTDDYDLCGRIEFPEATEKPFVGVLSMLQLMDRYFDLVQFPMRTMAQRTFPRAKRANTTERSQDFITGIEGNKMQELDSKAVAKQVFELGNEQGRATFLIKVLYRQNATWQGTIEWIGTGKSQHFRSTLELINLMEGALSQEGGPTAGSDW